MNNQDVVLTREGLEQLKAEYSKLANTKRPEVVERIKNAREQGDLSENSEYTAAREELNFIDGRILELEEIIKSARLITHHSKRSAVDLGCWVTLHLNGHKDVFHIVGEWEADPKEKKISHSSPLGKALLGKKVGEKIEVSAPAGKLIYKILSIE